MTLLPLMSMFLLSTDSGSQHLPRLDDATASRFVGLALDCVHNAYPNKIAHVMNSDQDLGTPQQLTPAFFGCFDWHSAVHGHWLLARMAHLFPDSAFREGCMQALDKSLTQANIAAEVAYIEGEGRATFERPYGLAWLLQLASELRQWDDPKARQWSLQLQPLESLCADRFRQWLPKLSHPIRTGEHSQTAFAFGLVLDWSRVAGVEDLEALVTATSREFYLHDVAAPLAYEPSGQDFLSPVLAEADLMRRVLNPHEFAAWLGAFIPQIPFDGRADWLETAVVTDKADGKLAHLDGLNLSRAWMLDGIAFALPEGDPRRASLLATASAHARSGLQSVTGEHYEGGHWLGSFAAYLLTRRGCTQDEHR